MGKQSHSKHRFQQLYKSPSSYQHCNVDHAPVYLTLLLLNNTQTSTAGHRHPPSLTTKTGKYLTHNLKIQIT